MPYPTVCRIPMWLLLLLSLLSPGLASAAAASSASIIELPLRFSLEELSRQAERQVPLEAGNWRTWRDNDGLETRYRAWRGPLSLQMRGDTLWVQAHVRYWVQVRKRLIAGLAPSMDCGVDEAARQAVIGLQVRLDWNRDWTPRPRFRILPTRFIDRCEMSLLNLDVSPLVGREFRRQMEHGLRRSLAGYLPSLKVLRDQAGQAWGRLSQPIPLGEQAWLLLNPAAAALSPVYGRGGDARVHLWLALFPKIVRQSPPKAAVKPPLPELQPYLPNQPELRFELNLELDYGRLSQTLTRLLREREYTLQDRRFRIDAVRLGVADQGLDIRLTLSGEAEGTVDILATPGFDPQSQSFVLTNLDYVFEPVDQDLYLLANLFYEKIRESLIDGANELLRSRMTDTGERLRGALAEIVPGGGLDMEGIRLSRAQISFHETGLRLRGQAQGAIRLGRGTRL